MLVKNNAMEIFHNPANFRVRKRDATLILVLFIESFLLFHKSSYIWSCSVSCSPVL